MSGPERDLDDAAEVFASLRPRLFGIAYRMLGSAAEAEDLVQDAWLRWQSTDRDRVEHPGAFLATTTTRLAVNHLQSARARRETYIGPWLPEPVDTSNDPYLGAERGEALAFASLMLMEKLTPTERAAFVLREAFDYPYAQIAGILQATEPAVRQLVSRARKRMAGEKRTQVSPAAQKELLSTFLAAARTGDLAELERLLAADVVSVSDGNGTIRVARRPVLGRQRAARFHAALAHSYWDGVQIAYVTANGQAAAVLSRDGAIEGLLTVAGSATGIEQVLWMANQEKLTAFARPAIPGPPVSGPATPGTTSSR